MQQPNTALEKMLQLVDRFHAEILDFPIPETPEMISGERKKWFITAMEEEIAEFSAAESVEEQADALLDIVYFALGRIVEMGLAPLPLFEEVNGANMKKVKGELSKRPGAKGYDALKPEGWTPPDLQPYLQVNWRETLDLANKMLLSKGYGGGSKITSEIEKSFFGGMYKTKRFEQIDTCCQEPLQLNLFRPDDLPANVYIEPGSEAEKIIGEDLYRDQPKTLKQTAGKAPLSRIPFEGIKMTADVFAFGAKKYSWNGYKVTPSNYTQFTDALIGHALAFANGRDLDPESGLNEIGHMGCNVMMLAWTFMNRPDMDNRKENMEGLEYDLSKLTR